MREIIIQTLLKLQEELIDRGFAVMKTYVLFQNLEAINEPYTIHVSFFDDKYYQKGGVWNKLNCNYFMEKVAICLFNDGRLIHFVPNGKSCKVKFQVRFSYPSEGNGIFVNLEVDPHEKLFRVEYPPIS